MSSSICSFLDLLEKPDEAEWRKYALPTYAIIGSDNGLSPGRRQPIIWTNTGIFLIEPIRRNFSEILIAIYTFSFKKIHLKMSYGKCRPFCLGLYMLKSYGSYLMHKHSPDRTVCYTRNKLCEMRKSYYPEFIILDATILLSHVTLEDSCEGYCRLDIFEVAVH